MGLLGGCALAGQPDKPTVISGIAVSRGSFRSVHRLGKPTGWTLVAPPGRTAGLPVWVLLHGLGGTNRSFFGPAGVALDSALSAHLKAGGVPIALASVDGGRSYWHPRPNGEDAGAMVCEEFLPMLRRKFGLTGGLALGGYSMGGYGALRLAGGNLRQRCAAVAVSSPALWPPGSTASASGFSSPEEYAEYSIFERQGDLRGKPVQIDCGTADPFYPATREYAAGFSADPNRVVNFTPGGHDRVFWRKVGPAQLEFVAHHLENSGR